MITVCLASYNGASHINEQVLSILKQLGPNDELVVSDNGSDDDTLNILLNFNDSRIKIYHEKLPGVIANFSNALQHANGDIIFLSDQDDVWMPDKVRRTLVALEKADLVLHDAVVVNEALEPIYDSLFKLNSTTIGFARNLIKNGYVGCCMAFNRNILNSVLPIPSSVGMHDWWIGLVAEKHFNVIHLNLPFIKYRRHANNVSNTSKRSKFSYFQRIKWRIYIILNILRLNNRRNDLKCK